MKHRPDATTSERQLAFALASSGRPVSLKDISNWRKVGLLPPLASHGLGTGKGKVYYWREENILQQAQTAFDAISRHGRADDVLITLFLSGFAVPLPHLRRAWLHRIKLRKPQSVQVAPCFDETDQWQPSADSLLLQVAIRASAAVGLHDAPECAAMVTLLERLISMLGFVPQKTNNFLLTAQFSHLLLVIASVLDAGDLIRNATDGELEEARQHLGRIVECLSNCADIPAPTFDTVAPMLFVLLLTLLRSGQTDILDRGMSLLQRVNIQPRPLSQGNVVTLDGLAGIQKRHALARTPVAPLRIRP